MMEDIYKRSLFGD